MNKLIFSEGGQPVYLDDFATIQEAALGQTQMFLSQIAKGYEDVPLLFNKKGLVYDTDDKIKAPGNVFLLNGELYQYDGAEFQQGIGIPYLCIHEDANDIRTFENGESKNCKIVRKAYLRVGKPSKDKYYDFFDGVKSFPTVARDYFHQYDSTRWTQLQVNFNSTHGYSGTIDYTEEEYCYKLRIKIHTGKLDCPTLDYHEIGVLTSAIDKFLYWGTEIYYKERPGEGLVREPKMNWGRMVCHNGTVRLILTDDVISYPEDINVILTFPK